MWFDEWVIKPGDDIYLAIERGLEAARVQVLCLSPAALGSEWVTLERSTVLFRDPTNAGRRFVPLLLADCTLPDTLRRYKYVDFRQETPAAFDELLAACREEAEAAPPAAQPEPKKKPSEARSPSRRSRRSRPSRWPCWNASSRGTRTGSTAWPSARMEHGRRRARRQDGQDLGSGDRRMPGDAGRAYGSGASPSRSRRMGSGFCRGRATSTFAFGTQDRGGKSSQAGGSRRTASGRWSRCATARARFPVGIRRHASDFGIWLRASA